MNTIINDSRREVNQFKQKLSQLETIAQSNSQNQVLYQQLKNKVALLEQNLNSKVDNLFNNVLQSDAQAQHLPRVRKRAISTETAGKSFEKGFLDESSLLVRQQMIYQKLPKTRYQISNDYEDGLGNAKLDLTFVRQRAESKRETIKQTLKQRTYIVQQQQFLENKKPRLIIQNNFKFLIRNGQRVMSLELMNLKNQFINEWMFINGIIKKLEQINRKHCCQYFFVDGKRVIRLMQKRILITLSDLLGCIINKEEIISHFKQRLYLTPDGQDRAVTKIQSAFRAFRTKKQFSIMKTADKNARVLQRFFKMCQQRIKLKKKIFQVNQFRLNEFKQRQKIFQQDWIPNQQCVEIHINTFSPHEYTRLSTEHFLQRENEQITRIFRIKNNNIIVIYITAIEMDIEIMKYYERICQLNSIPFNNIKILIPENSNKFPTHFSILQKLLYSPKCLNRIKWLISNKYAYIVPGYPSNDFILLSSLLKIPIYSGLPQHHSLYSTKSGSQTLLNKCQIPTSPGATEIYDEIELLNTLTVLIVKNPSINIWIFKIDPQFSGRGIATIKVSSISGIQSYLQKELDEDSITYIKQIIKIQLPLRLKIAVNTLYRTYQEFISTFLSNGGIIEAHPPGDKQNIQTSSVSFQLYPNNNIEIICNYDSCSFKCFRNTLYSYPSQETLDFKKIIDMISQFIIQKQMMGYFTINFLIFDQCFWAIGLDCFLNNQTSIYDYLTLINPNLNHNYHYTPIVYHPGLKKTLLKNFFSICKIETVHFDIENQFGQSFIFPDILQSCILQIVSIGQTNQQSIELLDQALKLIIKVAGTLNVNYGESIFESRGDNITLLDVQGALKKIKKTL